MMRSLLPLLLLACARVCGAQADAAEAVKETCAFDGDVVQTERCKGLLTCTELNGRRGPLREAAGGALRLSCLGLERSATDALVAEVPTGQLPEAMHACRDALNALYCARSFAGLTCGGAAAMPPCITACEEIVQNCGLQNAGLCTAAHGFGEAGRCTAMPRQNQIMIASKHSLSPIAADLVTLWSSDEKKYDNSFLAAMDKHSREAAKGQSFFAGGARWFDNFFGEDGHVPEVQTQFSRAQAAQFVIEQRAKATAKAAARAEGSTAGDDDAETVPPPVEPEPLFGWKECATVGCVFLAWRMQSQMNMFEERKRQGEGGGEDKDVFEDEEMFEERKRDGSEDGSEGEDGEGTEGGVSNPAYVAKNEKTKAKTKKKKKRKDT